MSACSVTARPVPTHQKPAYDDLIQGAATIPTLMADAGDGTPRYVPVTLADRVVGLMAVNAILGALMHQQRPASDNASIFRCSDR